MGKLFEELKRRKVFRVAAVYTVVAWVLIQVSSTILPTFSAPAWVNQTLTLLFILGFPIAVVLAWAYEVTPDRGGADSTGQAERVIVQPADRKLTYVILALLVLLGGFQITDRFLLDSLPVQSASANAGSDEQVRRSVLPLGPLAVPSIGSLSTRTQLSLSPNGSRLAYTEYSDRKMQLYVREMDQLEPRPLGPPLEDNFVTSLAFSPDGQSLAFFDSNDLKRVSVVGGGAQTVVADVANELAFRSSGLAWAEDDTILYTGDDVRLARVSATTGVSQAMNIPSVSSDPANEGHFAPQVLPDGSVLFDQSFRDSTTDNIVIFTGNSSEPKILIQNGRNATYIPPGFITFIREGSLWAVRFEIETLQKIGSEVMMIENIETLTLAANYTLAASGDLVYLNGDAVSSGPPQSTLAWLDRRGEETLIPMNAIAFGAPELSPDDSRVAVQIPDGDGNNDIWSYDLARGTLSRITFGKSARSPLWSPDGQRIIYSTPNGPESINTSGIGQTEQLLDTLPEAVPGILFPTTSTPDTNDILAYAGSGNAGTIYRVRRTPEQSAAEALLDSPDYMETAPAISPDGRWLAYVSNETGQDEVYVRPYPDINAGKWQVSTSGGFSPRWATGTGELFYRNRPDDSDLIETYAVAIADDDQFSAAIPELLFTSSHYALASNSYMVSSDGQRFLMMRPSLSSTRGAVLDTNVVLVENFVEELRRRVPVDMQ